MQQTKAQSHQHRLNFRLLCVSLEEFSLAEWRERWMKSYRRTGVGRTPPFTFCWQGRLSWWGHNPTYMDKIQRQNETSTMALKGKTIKRNPNVKTQMYEMMNPPIQAMSEEETQVEKKACWWCWMLKNKENRIKTVWKRFPVTFKHSCLCLKKEHSLLQSS